MAARIADDEFIRVFEANGAAATGRIIGISERSVHKRRVSLELRGHSLAAPHANKNKHSHRINLEVQDGIVLVGSDLHIWPGEPSVSMRAFLNLCRQLRPKAVILNGDVIDACTISRHPPIGWENQPEVFEELEAAQSQLHEIEKATPHGCKLTWNLGNHDARFETRLATVAPEFRKVKGVHLRDHFPQWQPAWATWINNDVVVKHRFKGGIHATHNNTLWAGKTVITGHLHNAKVTPLSDYNGTRYGVDTGCMADPEGKQFVDYTEDNPKNWRQAFCILTFWKTQLLFPELVLALDSDHVQFRGEVIKA